MEVLEEGGVLFQDVGEGLFVGGADNLDVPRQQGRLEEPVDTSWWRFSTRRMWPFSRTLRTISRTRSSNWPR
jgi:hypothetical protein